MIHSLSGGVISEDEITNYAKVQFENGDIYWYKTQMQDLNENDFVLVPFGNTNKPLKAKVIRLDKNISSKCAPVPAKRAKEIICKL